MLISEVITMGAMLPIQTVTPKDKTKKVQPVSRIAKTENESDVKKKPVPKGRIDTYA
jgi:hypothetical protein